MKDVDNDAAVRMGLDGAVESASGGGDVLAAVAFYCRWQLETASLMQISISICCTSWNANGTRIPKALQVETSDGFGNKLFAKFIAALPLENNKIIAWQIREMCT